MIVNEYYYLTPEQVQQALKEGGDYETTAKELTTPGLKEIKPKHKPVDFNDDKNSEIKNSLY